LISVPTYSLFINKYVFDSHVLIWDLAELISPKNLYVDSLGSSIQFYHLPIEKQCFFLSNLCDFSFLCSVGVIRISSYNRSLVLWFQEDYHWGKMVHTQEAHSSVLYHTCLIHFSHNVTQLLLKTYCLPTNLKFSLHHLNKCIHFYLAFWAPFDFGEANFHKTKGNTQQFIQWVKYNW
jgi:hypothetical protein